MLETRNYLLVMHYIKFVFILIFAGCLTACNTLQTSDDPTVQSSQDSLRGVNKKIYKFNSAVDKAVLRPVAKGYVAVIPKPARTGVHNFFGNLLEPRNILNNLLQGKCLRALSSTYRFVVNSTVGVLGLVDVASFYGVDSTPEDFGQTLAAWGAKPGPYIMLPFLGPTNLRDGVGIISGYQVYFPCDLVTNSSEAGLALCLIDVVDIRSQLLGLDETMDNQLDPYSFLKTAYEQNRLNQLYDGNPPEKEEDFDF